MMYKKGFTIVELLAVIAILGILSIMVVPAVIEIRKDYLEKTYESRLRLVENAALDWASANLKDVPSHVTSEYVNQKTCDCNCAHTTSGGSCICSLTIGKLIEEGYLAGSDNNGTILKNPLNNEVLNTKKVCVRYNTNDVFTRKIISYIEE